MNRHLLLRPVLMVIAALSAHGATLEYSQTFVPQPSAGLGWSELVTVPLFDTAEGTLDQIRFRWEGTVTDSLYVEASEFFGDFTGFVGTRAGVGISDALLNDVGGGEFAQTLYLVSLGAGGSTTVSSSTTGTSSWLLNPGDPGFTPFGVIGATLHASALDFILGFTGIAGTQQIPPDQNTIGGTLTVTYDYTPGSAEPVPEAGTVGAVSILGVLALAIGRRKAK